MKKLYVIMLTLLSVTRITQGCLSGTLEGSLSDSLNGNFDQFSLLLFTLEKNVVRIERYCLDELACDVNRVSRQASNSHCLYKLTLSEQGSSVTNIGWNIFGIDALVVETQRNKIKSYLGLSWAKLIAQGNEQPQDFMRAQVTIREIFNVNTAQADRANQKVIGWFSSLAIAWGLPSQDLIINLILGRRIQAAAAVVVPNSFIDMALDSCIALNKSDLITMGALVQLKNMPSELPFGARVNDGSQDDLHDIIEQDLSITSSVYEQILAKITSAKEFLYSYFWN
ncbi:MAG: hypothetical protein P4L31_03070 [Candidatus Babeliales bacterium]|nr:hypothetical protein [Candidatus Babeliales bacterium]